MSNQLPSNIKLLQMETGFINVLTRGLDLIVEAMYA